MSKKFNKIIQLALSLVALGAIFTLLYFYARPQAASDNLQVYFLDVGQGDAEYIKMPNGQDVLIDGGPDNSVLNELGKVMDFGDHEIDLVILSHPHADHLSGLVEVLKRYQVDEVWESGVDYPSATYDEWKKLISQKQIPDKKVKAKDEKVFGQVKILILYPLSSLESQKIDNLNNASVVNRLEYNKFSVLFLGDAEKEVQQKLAPQMQLVTVLKMAHHGSENGLTKDFLEVVRPAIAVISVGKNNKYNHPAQSTINILKSAAVRIFRTDQDGTIEISSDSEGYWVKNK